MLQYKGHELAFTEPRIYALIAAPPTYDYGNETEPGYDSSTKQWEREMDKADEKYGPIFAKYAAMSIEDVAQDPQALKMGSRLFANYCSICTIFAQNINEWIIDKRPLNLEPNL